MGDSAVEKVLPCDALCRTGGSVDVANGRVLLSQNNQAAIQAFLNVRYQNLLLQSNRCFSSRCILLLHWCIR